jgi:secreted trypsin-like serine protease
MLRSIFFSSLFAAAYAFNNTSNIGNIIGGQSIPSASSYPYMAYVAFPYNGGEVYCGGTLVAPGWVLTQARCTLSQLRPNHIV